MRYGRSEDEAMVYALALHDEAWSFEQIAEQLQRDVRWVRGVIVGVFMEERQFEPLH